MFLPFWAIRFRASVQSPALLMLFRFLSRRCRDCFALQFSNVSDAVRLNTMFASSLVTLLFRVLVIRVLH